MDNIGQWPQSSGHRKEEFVNVAYNEDCMAVMARYPDKYFDLAVVDPPYGNAGGGVLFWHEIWWSVRPV